jgi:hypothetical protein
MEACLDNGFPACQAVEAVDASQPLGYEPFTAQSPVHSGRQSCDTCKIAMYLIHDKGIVKYVGIGYSAQDGCLHGLKGGLR